MNILFVCRHNRFRSKFAESYFNKINNDSKLLARSAGIFPGTYPLDVLEVEISRKLGAEIKGYPKPVTTRLLRWNDLIVLITNDINDPENLFNYGNYKNKLIQWQIGDNEDDSEQAIENILTKIMKKVEELNEELNKK